MESSCESGVRKAKPRKNVTGTKSNPTDRKRQTKSTGPKRTTKSNSTDKPEPNSTISKRSKKDDSTATSKTTKARSGSIGDSAEQKAINNREDGANDLPTSEPPPRYSEHDLAKQAQIKLPGDDDDNSEQGEERRNTTLHNDFLKWYDKLDEFQKTDEIMKEKSRHFGLGQVDEAHSTLLHRIIKGTTKQLSRRLNLISWMMKEHPDLYKVEDKQQFTILDWALDPAHGDDSRVKFLLDKYPKQTAYLVLHGEQREEAFLQFIVPNIGNLLVEHQKKKSTHKWDFGPLKKSLGDLKSVADLALRRPNYLDPTIARARADNLIQNAPKELAEFLLAEKSYIHFIVPSLFNPESEVLCSKLFAKPCSTTHEPGNPYDNSRPADMDPANEAKKAAERSAPGNTSSDSGELVGHDCWPRHNETGNTLLHRLVEHKSVPKTTAVTSAERAAEASAGTSTESPPEESPETSTDILWQRRLVEQVYDSCPSALAAENYLGQSPYQFRLSTPAYIQWAKDRKGFDDVVSDFLKDKIMHLDRELTLRLLRDNDQDREIHLDLRELVYLDYSVSSKQIETLINGLKFESILQYVQIPRYPFKIKAKPSPTSEDDPNDQRGAGRTDFEFIFKALRARGVKKIIRLIVDDDEATPHSDESITAQASDFNIEEWNWAKTDIGSEVLREAAPNARKVTLYSSGNSAVLHGWSGPGGLDELRKLEEVRVFVRWRLEGQERTEKYANNFRERLKQTCPEVKVSLNIEKACSSKDNSLSNEEEMAPGAWLGHICKFLGFVRVAKKQVKPQPAAIRVAIIDDGYDGMDRKLNKSVSGGQSFFVRSSVEGSFKLANPYYCSTTGHGTVMARLVLSVCPDARLYIVRLNQGQGQTGILQPTAESAAQSIHWAINKGVHIISMSWTFNIFRKPDDPITDLEAAVERAAKAGIIMFGAASDQGYNSSIKPYPAASDSVICIGAALESGHAEGKSEKDANYFFPGSPQGVPLPQDSHGNLVVLPGSSVATAFASGLAALIIYCAQLTDAGKPYRKMIQTCQGMQKVLGRIADLTSAGRPSSLRYVGVHNSFRAKLGQLTWKEGKTQFDLDIGRLFANCTGENEIAGD